MDIVGRENVSTSKKIEIVLLAIIIINFNQPKDFVYFTPVQVQVVISMITPLMAFSSMEHGSI